MDITPSGSGALKNRGGGGGKGPLLDLVGQWSGANGLGGQSSIVRPIHQSFRGNPSEIESFI